MVSDELFKEVFEKRQKMYEEQLKSLTFQMWASITLICICMIGIIIAVVF